MFLLLPRVFYHWIIYSLGDFYLHLNSHRVEMEMDVNKKHLSDLGKGLCRSEGTPIGDAVDGLGAETMGYSLAFRQGDASVVQECHF